MRSKVHVFTYPQMSKWVTPHPTIGATNDAFRLPSSRPQETSAPFSPVPIQGKLKYRSEKLKENKLRIKKPTIRHSGCVYAPQIDQPRTDLPI